MEHSPREITSWVMNQALVNLRQLKLYQASFFGRSTMRLEISYGGKRKTAKNTSTWKLSNVRLNDQRIRGNQRGNQKHPETNDSENVMTQNLWNAAKVVLRGRFIAIQSHLKNKKYLK